MRKKKNTQPAQDKLCVCGHSFGAHYRPGMACCDPGCCETFTPVTRASVQLATVPNEPPTE